MPDAKTPAHGLRGEDKR